MHKAMIVALAALAGLLMLPLQGSAREFRHQGGQSHGSQVQRSHSQGSFQRGTQPRAFSSQRGVSRHNDFRGAQRHDSRGSFVRSGYRSGGHSYGGHRYYGGYPRHHSNVRFSGSVWLGPGWGPWWGPGWPYYPYYNPYYAPYYSSPPVVIEQAPTEYVEKDQGVADSNFWYHCSDPEGYYPTVQRCPSGWTQEIPSTPPDQ